MTIFQKATLYSFPTTRSSQRTDAHRQINRTFRCPPVRLIHLRFVCFSIGGQRFGLEFAGSRAAPPGEIEMDAIQCGWWSVEFGSLGKLWSGVQRGQITRPSVIHNFCSPYLGVFSPQAESAAGPLKWPPSTTVCPLEPLQLWSSSTGWMRAGALRLLLSQLNEDVLFPSCCC